MFTQSPHTSIREKLRACQGCAGDCFSQLLGDDWARVCQAHVQSRCVCSFSSVIVGVFTPWKLANTANQDVPVGALVVTKPGPDPNFWCTLFHKLVPNIPLHHLLSVKWNATADFAEVWRGDLVPPDIYTAPSCGGRLWGVHWVSMFCCVAHPCSTLPTLIYLCWLCRVKPFGNLCLLESCIT